MLNTYELALKIVEDIANNPENRFEDGKVNWCFVEADMWMDYDWMTVKAFNEAVDFIIESAMEEDVVVH